MMYRTDRVHPEEMLKEQKDLSQMREYLGSYRYCLYMQHLIETERQQAAKSGRLSYPGVPTQEQLEYWESQARGIRNEVESLTHPPEKTLLYYHYILGMSLEEAAFEMEISLRTAFRLKKQGLALLAKQKQKKEQSEKQGVS